MKNNIFHTMEHGLIYIGYVVGFVIFLENLSKIFRGKGETGVSILIMSLFVWFISFLSRVFISKHAYTVSTIRRLKVEFIYFLFCHTFVALFATTLLQHVPYSLNPVGYKYIKYKNYFEFLNYFSENLIFFLVINGVLIFMFLTMLLLGTRFLYKYFLYESASLVVDENKRTVTKILTYGLMLIITLIFLQIPVVTTTYGTVSLEITTFMKDNFQWLVDFFLGAPVFYYLYASFKGSRLAEDFSLYRKFI